MDKMDFNEKVWGGIFGVVAICAAIAEMFINGVDAASVAGAVKDVFGTAVVVILLVSFLKTLPHKPKNLKEVLAQKVEDWGAQNIPLIFKTENYKAAQGAVYTQGFSLLQKPETYVALANQNLNEKHPEWNNYAQYGNGKLTGKFLDMPGYEAMLKDKFDVLFILEQKHFEEMEQIDKIVDDIVSAINAKGGETISAHRVGASRKIKVTCAKITSVESADFFVNMLNFVFSLIKVIM